MVEDLNQGDPTWGTPEPIGAANAIEKMEWEHDPENPRFTGLILINVRAGRIADVDDSLSRIKREVPGVTSLHLTAGDFDYELGFGYDSPEDLVRILFPELLKLDIRTTTLVHMTPNLVNHPFELVDAYKA